MSSPTPQEQLGVPWPERLAEAGEVMPLVMLVCVGNECPIRRGIRPWVRLTPEKAVDREAYPDKPFPVWRCAAGVTSYAFANPVPTWALASLVNKNWLRLRAGDLFDADPPKPIWVQPTERAMALALLIEEGSSRAYNRP